MASTTPSRHTRILVLDADLVPALTVVRSLVKKQYVVDVASATEVPIASFSKGIADCLRYPNPLSAEKEFLDWMQALLVDRHYDLIIPVTERSLVSLSAHRQRFEGTRIAMADRDSLNRVLDKSETFKLAESLGVAVPRSIYLSNINELGGYLAELSYPVVVKPSRSVSESDAGYSKRSVTYANNEAELQKQCISVLRHSPVILQSYFQGVGAGIELIAKDGEILYPFQHVRLHEVPLTGGGSSFRVSAEIEPVLLEASRKLIQALRWTGVAMVEFKWNPDSGRYCLMEINGRLWGSLPLAVAAGADFPAMLAELSLTGDLTQYPAYRRGVYCRNLTNDLMWHELVLRARRSNKLAGPTRIPTGKDVLRDLALLFSLKHYLDTQSFSDPRPGLVEIKRLCTRYWGRLSGVLTEKRFARHQSLFWRNGTVRTKIRDATTVLFICYGNINRSAVAQVIMNRLLPEDCGKRVLSAGFHQEEARPADHRMQTIAAEHGFDLSESRSKCISSEMLETSDIIFVMEKRHYDDLVADWPDVADKVFLLGPGCQDAGKGAAEIPDPYNRSEQTYRACFAQIHQAVARLNEMIPADNAK